MVYTLKISNLDLFDLAEKDRGGYRGGAAGPSHLRIQNSSSIAFKGSKTGKIAKRIEYMLEWNLLEKSVKRPFC